MYILYSMYGVIFAEFDGFDQGGVNSRQLYNIHQHSFHSIFLLVCWVLCLHSGCARLFVFEIYVSSSGLTSNIRVHKINVQRSLLSAITEMILHRTVHISIF